MSSENVGVTQLELAKEPRSIPSESSRLKIVVQSTIHDRFWGFSTSETIWGSTPNKRMIEENLVDPKVRRDVAEFFVSRALAPIMVDLVGVRSLRPAETIFSKADIVKAVETKSPSASAAKVILEFLIPALVKIGTVSGNMDYSTQVTYGFDRVTVAHIRKNVTTHNVMEAFNAVKLNMDPKAKVSTAIFAENLAEALRPLGLAMMDMVELSGVIDDIVRGVRAHIDPAYNAGGVVGSVPSSWRNHAVVAELATNLVFLRSALSMPENSSLSLQTDEWKLAQWAPIVLAAIKSSERYAIVSKSQALQNYEIKKIRDVRDVPVSTVLVRNFEAQPVAQSVFALRDTVVSHAYNINATKDRIAEVVQMAYGKANFSTIDAANMLVDNLTDYIDQGYNGYNALYKVDVSELAESVTDLAIFVSDHVYVEFVDGRIALTRDMERAVSDMGDDADDLQIWDPIWYFYVPTTEKALRPWSGQHLGNVIVTSDPAEVFLAAAETEKSVPVPVRPQLLGPAAFNSRLVGYDIDGSLIKSSTARYALHLNVAGVEIAGALKASDFASLRANSNTCLVKPHFNSAVIAGTQAIFRLANTVTGAARRKTHWVNDKAPSEVFSTVQNRSARSLLLLAQQLSPAYRQEVHEMIIEKALVQNRKSGSEADLFRSRLVQKTFGAVADLVALSFFLYLQGIECDVWDEMIKSPELMRVCADFGTDRDIKFI